jgi:hypothetical protein
MINFIKFLNNDKIEVNIHLDEVFINLKSDNRDLNYINFYRLSDAFILTNKKFRC